MNSVFEPIEKKGRHSLVPFRLSFTNNATESQSSKKSDLYKDFNTLNRESAIFKNSNLDFANMLDFF